MTGTTATSPAIETTELTKRYGRTTALAGLTMRVERGEVFGFLGPNGAGKTTAVKLLLGLVRPTSGAGRVLGAPVGDRATRARIGYLPELFRYQSWLTAREVLALHCELAGLARDRWSAEIDAALELVGLAARAGDQVGSFSKGMQQRLGLGVALLGSPDLVVLDEPTSALDPIGRNEVRDIVRGVADRGGTVFLNSHLLTEVERVCDRVAIVDGGRVIASGRPRDIATDTGVRVRAEPTARVAAVAAAYGSVTLADGAVEVGCPPERVPDLVADLVAAGIQVHGVEPRRVTLEDRFLALVGGGDRGAA